MANTLSEERIAKYLIAAGYDPQRALNLYLWNVKIGEAFHMPIQALEVAIRNRTNVALTSLYGDEWWQHHEFQAIAEKERQDDLAVVFRRIKNRQLPLVNGQVVAGLSFGFWVGLLQAHYNPAIWSSQLKIAFPDLPVGKTRKVMAKRAGEIAFIRNRITHHEPIFKRDLSKDFMEIMEFLGWVCPTKAAWVKPHCRVHEILRQKP